MNKILSTAIGQNVTIGEGVFIDTNVTIEDNVIIEDGCYITGNTIIEQNVRLSPYVSIGTPGEHKYKITEKYDEVRIGANSIIREFVTINAPVEKNGITQTGKNCYLMSKSHMGHDSILGDECVLSTGSMIGGHAQLGDYVTVGLNAIVHQWVIIGDASMIGALTPVSKDVLPFTLVRGSPARWYKINKIGMQIENRFDHNEIETVSKIFDELSNEQEINELFLEKGLEIKNIRLRDIYKNFEIKSHRGIVKYGG